MADEATLDPQATADNPVRPDGLPDNFTDVAALAESYKEAQRKITEESQARAALEENYTALANQVDTLQAQNQQAQQQQAANPLIAQYTNAMEQGDYGSALAIQAQINGMVVRDELSKVVPQVQQQYQTVEDATANQIAAYASSQLQAQYGERYDQARDKMYELVQRNPHLIPQEARVNADAARVALDNVYKLATYDAPPPPVDTSQADATQMKTLAQTATGQGGRVLTPDEAQKEWDAIKGAGQQNYYDGLNT